ncbi:MAG: KpsF/GutQ family sugar-phosphate isomerase [Candidatus Aminicenantes bacterium]|nr:KpsF/GutQ family sugar-phosphate isomerase [Candidatus Aminicenantes bacterium]
MNKNKIIETGKKVIQSESLALEELASSIDENFVKAVHLLSEIKGRAIVTGVGKSGLVGRKIAATFSSCGTPSMFIHPVEAGHGDLGMIVSNDIIIAISYSGNTKEIVPILDFVKRIGIQLIGITGNKHSKLAKYSDVVLEAKVEKEAEPDNVVPTSSSTAALAIGDALAITLMKIKKFTRQDFASFHPRGELGKKLLKVKNLMHKGQQIPFVKQDTPMPQVLKEMTEKQLGVTCVIDAKGHLRGIITDGDLRRKLQDFGNQILNKKAKDCMTSGAMAVSKEALATEALNIMEKNKITSLIIKDQSDRIQGVIHLHDLWRTEMF